eukprot:s917_g3.t1
MALPRRAELRVLGLWELAQLLMDYTHFPPASEDLRKEPGVPQPARARAGGKKKVFLLEHAEVTEVPETVAHDAAQPGADAEAAPSEVVFRSDAEIWPEEYHPPKPIGRTTRLALRRLYVCHGKKVKECEEDPGRADDLGLEHLEVPVLLVAAFSAALSLSCAIRSTLQKEDLKEVTAKAATFGRACPAQKELLQYAEDLKKEMQKAKKEWSAAVKKELSGSAALSPGGHSPAKSDASKSAIRPLLAGCVQQRVQVWPRFNHAPQLLLDQAVARRLRPLRGMASDGRGMTLGLALGAALVAAPAFVPGASLPSAPSTPGARASTSSRSSGDFRSASSLAGGALMGLALVGRGSPSHVEMQRSEPPATQEEIAKIEKQRKKKVAKFDPAKQLGVCPPLGFFDPLGFAPVGKRKNFRNLRTMEIKHGRVAMMASVGAVVQHFIHRGDVPEKWQTYLGSVNPNGLGACAIFYGPPGFLQLTGLLFVAFIIEFIVWVDRDDREPGDYGTEQASSRAFFIASRVETMREKKAKELAGSVGRPPRANRCVSFLGHKIDALSWSGSVMPVQVRGGRWFCAMLGSLGGGDEGNRQCGPLRPTEQEASADLQQMLQAKVTKRKASDSTEAPAPKKGWILRQIAQQMQSLVSLGEGMDAKVSRARWASYICMECEDALCSRCSAQIHRVGARQNHTLVGLRKAAYSKRLFADNLDRLMGILQRNIERSYDLSPWFIFYDQALAPSWYNFTTYHMVRADPNNLVNPPIEDIEGMPQKADDQVLRGLPGATILKDTHVAQLTAQGACFDVPPPVHVKFAATAR